MHNRIITDHIVLLVVAVADVESTVGILIINITLAGLICPNVCVIVAAIPIDILKPHGCVGHIEHLKLAVLVSSIKNQVTTMNPAQALMGDILRLRIPYSIVPTAVLQHYGLDLPLPI